jgi:hypothetical protein
MSARRSRAQGARRPAERRLDLRAASLFYGAAALVLVGLIAFAAVHEVTARQLARDPLSLAGERPYLGALSQFGILAWAAGAAACLVAYLVLRGSGERSEDRQTRRFFLAGGVLTAILALDDLFQIHENAAQLPGLSEPLVLLAYPLLIAGFLAAFWRSPVLRLVRPLFAASLFFLAASIGLDRLPEDALVGFAFWEDGAKLLGIAGWAASFTCAAVAYLRPAEPASARPEHRAAPASGAGRPSSRPRRQGAASAR